MPIPEIAAELRKRGLELLTVADLLDGKKKPVQSVDRKLHWTQRPENRLRVEAWMRKMTRARRTA